MPRCLARSALIAAALAVTAAAAEPPPDILLVTIDTLRADHLGAYGYFRDTSPAIDRLAAESILFERCYTPLAYTLPAHLSLLTASFPLEHGVLGNLRMTGHYFDRSAGAASFAEFARRAGYTTAAFVSSAVLHRDTGIAAGFEVYSDVPEQAHAADTIDRALAFLDGEPRRPFFLWVHLYDPHQPYKPPQPFDRRFATDARLERDLAAKRISRNVLGQLGEPQTFAGAKAVDLYDGEIAYADAQLGRLFDRLRRDGLYDRMLIVLTSDHGEALGQHGRTGHGGLYLEHLHVPLLVRAPGERPRRVPDPLSLVDALPTALARVPGHPFARFLAGASGRDALAGGGRDAVFSQQQMETADEPGSFALTDRYWSLIRRRSGTVELYRLLDDRYELVDRARQAPAQRRRLLERLDEELAGQRRRAAAFEKAGRRRGRRIDPERLKKLRALGYAD